MQEPAFRIAVDEVDPSPEEIFGEELEVHIRVKGAPPFLELDEDIDIALFLLGKRPEDPDPPAAEAPDPFSVFRQRFEDAFSRKHAVSSPIYVSVQFFEVFLGQFQDVFFRSMESYRFFGVFPQPDHHSLFPGSQGSVELDCRVIYQSSVDFYRHCPHSMDHSCRREN